MSHLRLNLDYASSFFSDEEWNDIKLKVNQAAELLSSRQGPGNEFLGWLDLPFTMQRQLDKIQEVADNLRSHSEVFVVIGIGGSYLGAKAALDCLTHQYYNQLDREKRNAPEIYFAGTDISAKALQELVEIIGDRSFSVNVISKSGTTTEPAIAFRLLKQKLENRYGVQGAVKRIICTTDKSKGALNKMMEEMPYSKFVIPDNVGGRFSVLTAVGLLPLAVAGVPIEKMLYGANQAAEDFSKPFDENVCYQYAGLRNLFYDNGKNIEILVSYEPSLAKLAEWWKQLYGESEGKEGKGLFPASCSFTTDLHSMGQFVQDGPRHMFETVLRIEHSEVDLVIQADDQNLDGLNYLAGKGMNYVNTKAMQGTIEAHVDGKVPNIILNLPKMDAFHLGYLFFFFEKACAVSAYMLGVNPFDQPGVEAYKSNMFRLLGKP
jgi:glucose-6-phosphate isomerase